MRGGHPWESSGESLGCQTEEVLQADVVYKFGFEDGLGSTEKLELVEQVAGSVGIDHHSSNVNEVRGDDLYLGVKLKANCFKLADDDLTLSHPAFDGRWSLREMLAPPSQREIGWRADRRRGR